jgi:hypothetical protein
VVFARANFPLAKFSLFLIHINPASKKLAMMRQMLRPRRPEWNGVKSGAKDATNGVIRGAEAAKRPLAPGPLAQSSLNVVGQNSESAGVIVHLQLPALG